MLSSRSAKASWKLRHVPYFLTALGQWVLLAAPANATLILEDPNAPGFPTHPAFSASLVIPLDETLPVNPGDRSFTITRDGMEISFQTPSSDGLFICRGPGRRPPCNLHSFDAPIAITFNPPISAFGVVGEEAECGYAVTMLGSLGTESHDTGFNNAPIFIGAADVGDISVVTLDDTCQAIARWTSMRIVPGSVMPGQSDVRVDKRGPFLSGALVGASYTIDVANNGPDTAEIILAVDFLPPGTTFTGASAGGTLDPAARIVTWSLGDLAAPGGSMPSSALLTLNLTTPPFAGPGRTFSCEDTLLNIAVATTTTSEQTREIISTGPRRFSRSRRGRPSLRFVTTASMTTATAASVAVTLSVPTVGLPVEQRPLRTPTTAAAGRTTCWKTYPAQTSRLAG